MLGKKPGAKIATISAHAQSSILGRLVTVIVVKNKFD